MIKLEISSKRKKILIITISIFVVLILMYSYFIGWLIEDEDTNNIVVCKGIPITKKLCLGKLETYKYPGDKELPVE